MWLAVDAAGPGATAWPVGDDSAIGPPVAAATAEEIIARLDRKPERVVLDGAPDAPALSCPAAPEQLAALSLRREIAGISCVVLPALSSAGGAVLRGVARAVGAHQVARGKAAPARPLLVCECRAGGSVAWVHFAEDKIGRFVETPIGGSLREVLSRPVLAARGARDEDDDVAFERGLSLAEDAQDLGSDIARAVERVAAGDTQGSAAGALLAGVLVGHDCARGLRLGRLGGPMALVGAGLTAERYSVALARFGVAVRRIAPQVALRDGCRRLIGDEPPGGPKTIRLRNGLAKLV